MANLMNTVKLIIHICVIVHACVNTCNIHVCLTWEFENSSITFKCKVNHLSLNVEFYNPANQNEGWCLTPYPNTSCFSHPKNNIFQDKLTNTTTLTVKSSMAHNNGTWKCTHGTNINEAIVKIPVLTKDSSMEDTKVENCFEEFCAWTMLGFTMTIVITLLYNTVFFLTGRKSVYDCLCVPFSNVPTVDVKQPNDSVSTGTNSSLILHCTFKSTLPVKSFYWRKDDGKSKTTIACKTNKYKEMTTSTPSLTILNVDQSDEGSYTCFATNRVGTGQSTTIKLYVKEENESSSVLVCDSKHDTSLVEDSNNKKKAIIGIVLSVIIVVLPVCVGFIAKDCKFKEYFVIYGIFKALVMLIFSYNLVTHYVKDYELIKKNTVTDIEDHCSVPGKPQEHNKPTELAEDPSKSPKDYANDDELNEKNTVTNIDNNSSVQKKQEEPTESTGLLENTEKSTEDYDKDYELNEKNTVTDIDDNSPVLENPEEQKKSTEILEDPATSTKADYVKDYKLTEESTIIYIDENSSEPDEPATEIKVPKRRDSYPDSDHAADAV